MAEDTDSSARELVDRLINDAPFQAAINAAPTRHDQLQVILAAGYDDVSVDAIRAALKVQLAAIGAGVQVDPARVTLVHELFAKAATDPELRQALQAAATPEAKREVLAKAGYGDITENDVRAAAADLAQREELSDEELDLASGGANYTVNYAGPYKPGDPPPRIGAFPAGENAIGFFGALPPSAPSPASAPWSPATNMSDW
jgi:predicted ribosomally synthesized peptide with nif11-like leader